MGGWIEVYQVVKVEKRRESTSLPARKNKTSKNLKTNKQKNNNNKTAWPGACLKTRSNLRSECYRYGLFMFVKVGGEPRQLKGKELEKR